MKRKIIISISLIMLIICGSILIKLRNDNNNFLTDNIETTLNEKDIKEEKKDFINDGGIFSDYYNLAKDKLNEMTIDEKIGQLFIVKYPNNTAAASIQKEYQFGGYIFFEEDFENKTEEEVKKMIDDIQTVSKIPLLTAVDEEGGEITRVSTNKRLVEEKFKSPSELYELGGMDLIKEDTLKKSDTLSKLGLNLNIAPVVDVSTNPEDYIHNRTIKQNTEITSEYAKTVIETSKKGNVSYVLKHFPGYGNNNSPHDGTVVDNRSYQSIIENDIPPFEIGIKSGAEAILISHNIIMNIDKENPASLSKTIHNFLRTELNFTGIIISENLSENNTEKDIKNSIMVGNNIIIISDYKAAIETIKDSINNNEISEEQIDDLVLRVIAWKYYKGILYEKQK